MKNFNHYSSPDVQPSITAELEALQRYTLQSRREHDRIIVFYKFINNLIKIPETYHPVPKTNRDSENLRTHPNQYERHSPTVDAYLLFQER